MSRYLAGLLAGACGLLAAILVCQAPILSAQEKGAAKKPDKRQDLPKPERFTQQTFDHVTLVGDFYPAPSTRGGEAPVVLLLHAAYSSRKSWGKFPELLQEEGYAVLAFDFRAHGDSTEIDPKEYWKINPLRRGNYNNPPKKLELRDLGNYLEEWLKLGNDIYAAKDWLNLKNNQGLCNSSNIILVGAEQGALLGLMWAYVSLQDRARFRADLEPEIADITCAIWLSMRPTLANKNLPNPIVEKWLKSVRDKLPTLVVYGEADKPAANFWKRAYDWIKPPRKREQYEYTRLKEIEKTSLAGAKLLNQDNLDTEKWILEYLKMTRSLQSQRVWRQRKDTDRQQTPFPAKLLGL